MRLHRDAVLRAQHVEIERGHDGGERGARGLMAADLQTVASSRADDWRCGSSSSRARGSCVRVRARICERVGICRAGLLRALGHRRLAFASDRSALVVGQTCDFLVRRFEDGFAGGRQVGEHHRLRRFDRRRRLAAADAGPCRRTSSRAPWRCSRHRPAPAVARGSSANRPGISAAHGCGRGGRTRAAPSPSSRRALCLRRGTIPS